MKRETPKGKKLPMPKEALNGITDSCALQIDRVSLAEEYREEYGYTCQEMAAYVGVTVARYYQYLRILRSENTSLIEEVRKGNCSVRRAIQLLNDGTSTSSPLWKMYFKYPYISRVERLDAEILFEGKSNILYRSEGNMFLGCAGRKDEVLCKIDDNTNTVSLVLSLLHQGMTIQVKNLCVFPRDQNRAMGSLKHHIVAGLLGIPVDAVRKAKVALKREPHEGIYDFRISNLSCPFLTRHDLPNACGGFVIAKSEKEILIIDESRNIVYKADYQKWLYQLLQEKNQSLRVQSRDNRLCVSVNGRLEYIYHVIMAMHIYGDPNNEEDMGEKLALLRRDIIDKGSQIDHLNADVNDNKLCNLMVMSCSQNIAKMVHQNKLNELGLPYFCWAERYDDTSVRMEAGYAHPLGPSYRVRGVFSVAEYIDELKKFVASAQNERLICGAFNELDKCVG